MCKQPTPFRGVHALSCIVGHDGETTPGEELLPARGLIASRMTYRCASHALSRPADVYQCKMVHKLCDGVEEYKMTSLEVRDGRQHLSRTPASASLNTLKSFKYNNREK